MKNNMKTITRMSRLVRLTVFMVVLLPFVLKSQKTTKGSAIDSLKGFNEPEIRERLKSNNVVGSELENHIKQLKRDYINQIFFTVRRKDEESK